MQAVVQAVVVTGQANLDLVDQALAWNVPRLPVVADSAYGNDFDFRAGLRERGRGGNRPLAPLRDLHRAVPPVAAQGVEE